MSNDDNLGQSTDIVGTDSVSALGTDSETNTDTNIDTNTAPKDFVEYFRPIPIINFLTSDVWGESNVLPRDTENGMEDVARQLDSHKTVISW